MPSSASHIPGHIHAVIRHQLTLGTPPDVAIQQLVEAGYDHQAASQAVESERQTLTIACRKPRRYSVAITIIGVVGGSISLVVVATAFWLWNDHNSVSCFNQLIAVRNAVWASPVFHAADFEGARVHLRQLKQSDFNSADRELRVLRDELIEISDRKMELTDELRKIVPDPDSDEWKASGTVEQVLSVGKVMLNAKRAVQLREELTSLNARIGAWDRDMQRLQEKRGW